MFTLFPKRSATLISRFFMVALDQGQWPHVMSPKRNAPESNRHLAQSLPTYTPPQKKGNFRKVSFGEECPSRQLTVHWQPTMLKSHKGPDFHLPQSQNCLLGYNVINAKSQSYYKITNSLCQDKTEGFRCNYKATHALALQRSACACKASQSMTLALYIYIYIILISFCNISIQV